MRKQDKLGMDLAHALAMKAAAVAARNPRARDYWFDEITRIRRELQLELHDAFDGKPAPEQPPLIVDDLTDKIRPGKKSTKR